MATTLVSQDDGTVPGKTYEEKLQNLKKWYECSLDSYYEKIKNFTFKTIFIPIPKDVLPIWQKYNRKKPLLKIEEEEFFNKIEKPFQEAIDKLSKNVFVRLNTRSPKDVVDKLPDRYLDYLRKELQTCKNINDEYIALRRSFFRCLKVTNAKEALQLFSYSFRVISDIKRAIDFDMPVQIVVREFVEFDVCNEFRGFYKNGKLNALSQYDIYAKPNMDFKKIENLILSFFEKNKEFIPLKECIIDFVVKNDQVYILELNPFLEDTGSALFDWKKDYKILCEGPFEFRYQTNYDEMKLKAIMTPWNWILKKAKSSEQENLPKKKKWFIF